MQPAVLSSVSALICFTGETPYYVTFYVYCSVHCPSCLKSYMWKFSSITSPFTHHLYLFSQFIAQVNLPTLYFAPFAVYFCPLPPLLQRIPQKYSSSVFMKRISPKYNSQAYFSGAFLNSIFQLSSSLSPLSPWRAASGKAVAMHCVCWRRLLTPAETHRRKVHPR